MEQALKISEIAKKFKKDRTTVLRWIERGLFPNAEILENPLGNYWVIPESDLKNFVIPKRGGKKKSEVIT